jgi:nucleoporin POM152
VNQGAGPLRLNYLKSWSGQSENVTVPIRPGRTKVTVPVPPALSAESGASGKLSIVLLSIEDGNGCVRKLPAPTVEVDINRQKVGKRVAPTRLQCADDSAHCAVRQE